MWWNDRAGGDQLGDRWAWSLVVVRELPSRSDDPGHLYEMLIIWVFDPSWAMCLYALTAMRDKY